MTTRAPAPVATAPRDVRMLARALLATAAEVEAAESALKAEVLRAARAGDCAKVIDIVTKWQTQPPVDIANSLPKPP